MKSLIHLDYMGISDIPRALFNFNQEFVKQKKTRHNKPNKDVSVFISWRKVISEKIALLRLD